MTYLEIKKHSGPCRLGEMHIQNSKVTTPNFLSIAVPNLFLEHDIYLVQEPMENLKLAKNFEAEPKVTLFSFFSKNKKEKKEFGILPSFSTGYNVSKHVAESGVEETIKTARDLDKNNENGASAEGTKYVELAKKCIDEFREKPLLRISYGDKLQKEPRKLVEIVTYAREKLSPNSILYFPEATPWMLCILAYMGVDLFDNLSAIESAHNGIYFTKSREFLLGELTELSCECSACKKSGDELIKTGDAKLLAEHNFNVLSSAMKEIREHARKNLLRELVEERCCSSVDGEGTLRILDREKQDFLERYTPVHPSSS